MDSEKIKKLEDEYTANTYARYDVAIASGKGAIATDPEGREYIDFASGIGVNSLGYCEPGWVEAVQKQAGILQHASNLYYTGPCASAAEKLIELTGMSNVFFANSGAEANEGAIKAARKYSSDRSRIVTLTESFHGRTMATITATGQDSFHKYFTPFLEGFGYAETNNIESLHETVTDDTCAIMIEFIQGEGGVNELDQAFVDEIVKICGSRDILLIADEVQTGVGRTGRFMSYEHFGVKPDIVTIAKGIGGGLPVGCVLFGEKAKDVFGPGDHGSTFGANPVVCAGANYVLARFMDGGAFLADIVSKGEYFRDKLITMPGVKGVNGKGLMIGIDIGEKDAKAIVGEGVKRGLLTLTAKDKVRLLPPLNIEYEAIDKGLSILVGVMEAV